MKHSVGLKALSVASALLAVASVTAPAAHADEWNKRTIMTIDKPILIPNKELQPGTYVVKLLNSESNRNIVEIYNSDETHLISIVLAIPNYRLQPTGKTKFSFWETPAGDPPALRAWFYPGDNFGQEFAYPKDMVAKLSASNQQTPPTLSDEDQRKLNAGKTSNSAAATTANETATATNTGEAERSANPPAPPAAAVPTPPVTQPETTPQAEQPAPPQPTTPPAAEQPAPATNPTPNNELPQTASDYPAIVLAGIVALAVFGLLTFAAKKRGVA